MYGFSAAGLGLGASRGLGVPQQAGNQKPAGEWKLGCKKRKQKLLKLEANSAFISFFLFVQHMAETATTAMGDNLVEVSLAVSVTYYYDLFVLFIFNNISLTE